MTSNDHADGTAPGVLHPRSTDAKVSGRDQQNLAARTLEAIEKDRGAWADDNRRDADWDRVQSDLDGLREHSDEHMQINPQNCGACGKFDAGLRRTARLYGVIAPAPTSESSS